MVKCAKGRPFVLCTTDVVLRTRCRLTLVGGHKGSCRLGNGVNTIFFAAWLLTTLQRGAGTCDHLHSLQPSAHKDHRHRHRHSQTSGCMQRPALAWLWLSVVCCWIAGCYGSTVLDPGPSGFARCRLQIVLCSPASRHRARANRHGLSFREPGHSPPYSPSADPCLWSKGSVLPVGRSGLSARFRDGSVNEPPS